MYSYLSRRAAVHGKTYYIEGTDLLRLLQKTVNGAKTTPSRGAGTGDSESPWRLSTPAEWIGRAVNLPKNEDNYLIVGGRLILRGRDQYVEDAGPAWRATQPTAPNSPPAGPSTTDMMAFEGVAPTYRAAAQAVVDPNRILPDATERRRQAGIKLAESWKEAGKQPVLVSVIRSLLKAEKISLFFQGKLNRDYSRMQTALPVLVVAMFLAEPARNPRAFPINLMLLDLAQRGVYTMDRIFWHPHALDVDKEKEFLDGVRTIVNPTWNGLLPIPSVETGPTSKETRKVITLQNRGQLHLVGGIMPASPTGGGELAKVEAMPGKFGGKKPAFNADYIHSKEVSVLLRWLQLATFGAWQASVTAPAADGEMLPYSNVAFPSEASFNPKKMDGAENLKHDLVRIENLIKRRTHSFDAIP